MLLKGKVAIVTGGGRGIGRAIALRFAAEGAAVVVSARGQAEIDGVVKEIQNVGGRAAAVQGDVSKESGADNIVSGARKAFGSIHILVNNAGIYGPVKPVEKLTAAEWDEALGINLRGPFLMSRAVLPEMYERGSGAILNLTTIAAKIPFALNGPYAASKAGLMGLTRTLAAEGAKRGVRVNAVSPGPVAETKMWNELEQNLADNLQIDREQMAKNVAAGILQGRPQAVEEIAAAAVFLVSDQSSAITGQILNVDGGMAFY
jgi:meso-butanediol dehydrogenase/(S,S)-butanediol dehydrogenase/diacetyl reductase